MKDVGNTIKTMRKSKGLSQKELGKMLGLSYVAVGHWERNENLPNGRNLVMLSKILGCSPTDLLGDNASNDDIMETNAAMISEAYKAASPEFQEAAKRFFGIALENDRKAYEKNRQQ